MVATLEEAPLIVQLEKVAFLYFVSNEDVSDKENTSQLFASQKVFYLGFIVMVKHH